MSAFVQNAVAIAACLAATVFVAWRAWRALAGRASGCGTGCGSCSSSAQKMGMSAAKPLLSIEAGRDERLPRNER